MIRAANLLIIDIEQLLHNSVNRCVCVREFKSQNQNVTFNFIIICIDLTIIYLFRILFSVHLST